MPRRKSESSKEVDVMHLSGMAEAESSQFPEIAYRIRKYIHELDEHGQIISGKMAEPLPVEKNDSFLSESKNEPPKTVAFPEKRRKILSTAHDFLQNIDEITIEGKPLRPNQSLAMLGFKRWISEGISKPSLMGHVVSPPGTGKTNLSVLLSQMVPGKTLVIAFNNKEGVLKAFQNHELTLPEGKRRKIGACYDKHKQTDADVIVSHFSSQHKWKDIDWQSIDLIIVDEADINGLSEERSLWLREMAQKYSIPIVATTATEEQASGKSLQDVFPDEIHRIGMPDGLPEALNMGIVAPMIFHDLYLDASFRVDKKAFKKGGLVSDEKMADLIDEYPWIQGILMDYQMRADELGHFPKAVVAFPSNSLNRMFIKLAKKAGIKVEAYEGKLTDEHRLAAQEKVAKGELDMVVGSDLLSRGLHIPGIELVYNSRVTYSPQVFWQAGGRGASPNPNQSDAPTHIVAVLPRHIVDKETGAPIPRQFRPLSHAAFFDPLYYGNRQRFSQGILDHRKKFDFDELPSEDFDLDLRQAKKIRSIKEVMRVTKTLKEKPEDFTSRSIALSQFIDSLEYLNRSLIKLLIGLGAPRLKKWTEQKKERIYLQHQHALDNPYLDHDEMDELAVQEREEIENRYAHLLGYEDLDSEDNYVLRLAKNPPLLTTSEEKSLIKKAQSGDKKATRILFHAHFPLILSIARKMKPEGIGLSDLINKAYESLNELIQSNKAFRGGLSNYVMMGSFNAIQGYIAQHEQNVRIPIHAREAIQIRERKNTQRIHELRHPKSTEVPPSEVEYLRAIGLGYENIRDLQKWASIKKATIDLPKISSWAAKASKTLASLKKIKGKENKIAEKLCEELDISEEQLKNALEFGGKAQDYYDLRMNVERIQRYIEKIKADPINEAILIRGAADQLERDHNQWADVHPNEALYHALEASGKSDPFDEDRSLFHRPPEQGEAMNKADLVGITRRILSTLTAREEKVLRMHLGMPNPWTNGENLDLGEIGLHFEVTRVRIQQIESKALRKLRHPSRSKHLRPYSDPPQEKNPYF